uniref:Uncharacterized protein n=1 Tax=Picea sitchensis TaxID=3332 RepID=A0A6B9XR30_PICSI|nr:hypothetical protein Q903MT_gene5609 [Picea sitchensis]
MGTSPPNQIFISNFRASPRPPLPLMCSKSPFRAVLLSIIHIPLRFLLIIIPLVSNQPVLFRIMDQRGSH